MRQKFDVRIPMRDGIELSADVWLPDSAGRHPVILVRTPYLKTMAGKRFPALGRYFASKGYVFAVQDVRGRGDSDGAFRIYLDDADDGYDTVEWLASQSWTNGRVGMMGVSYSGGVQWHAARARPPHLACIAPGATGAMDVAFTHLGGAFLLGSVLGWLNMISGRIDQEPNAAGVDWDAVFRHRPLLTMDEALGRQIAMYRTFLEHPDWAERWESVRLGPEEFSAIDIPVLHTSGWFDGDLLAVLYLWRGMATHSPARARQHLVVGPWTHGQTFEGGSTTLGDMRFSADAVLDMRRLHLEFFDHYLKRSSKSFEYAPARIYVTGDNAWRALDRYPPDAQDRRLYLHSQGSANSHLGDGRLSWESPADQAVDRFVYHPRNPVPSGVGSASATNDDEALPLDHRPIERRDDVLVYTSDALDEPVVVIGAAAVELYAASDCADTDFTAKLLDVYPDGRAVKLGSLPIGVVRARYRGGYETPAPLTPGRVERFRIELFDLAHAFLHGHRIRLEISSSAFPFVAPNHNTGKPIATDTDWKIANQVVFHDSEHPSHLVLSCDSVSPYGPNRRALGSNPPTGP